ncbi:MAG: response regulator [Clostridia bacterium]|nr:response regulator [Clostridia bacterium]
MNLNLFSDIPIHQNSEFIKVLIIDDDYELRRNLCKFLSESKNIQVCACLEGGIDIEKEVEMYEPDVVVTEFSANDRRGKSILEILNGITEHKPKVIVLSSSENVSALDESFGYGVNYYVKKPVILSLLKNAIISICSDKVHEHHKI